MAAPAPFLLEEHYRDYLREGRRALHHERAMQAALRHGAKPEAELHLGRRWRALIRMRSSLERAWPGIEMFARRELSARGVRAQSAALEHLHRQLREGPPPMSHRAEIAGLYGFIRRTLRRAPCGRPRGR